MTIVQGDVSVEADVISMFARARADLGAVAGVVVNAVIVAPAMPLADMGAEPAATRLGSPGQYVDYAGSKAALDTLAVGLAKELGPEGVRVNAVRPGLIDTGIHAASGDPGRARTLGAATPLGRAGSPDEVAEAIVWLLSDAASYVTGAILDVAGGR